MDLALPVEDGWPPVIGGDQPGPGDGLHFAAEAEPYACLGTVGIDERAYWDTLLLLTCF